MLFYQCQSTKPPCALPTTHGSGWQEKTHDDIPISPWETALNEARWPVTAEVESIVHAEASGEVHHRPFERFGNDSDDVNAHDQKSAVKELITNELTKLVEELL